MSTELQNFSGATTTEPEGPSLLDYIGVFRRRVKTILIPAILVAIIGGVVAFVIPPQYEAETKFQVEDPSLVNVAGFGNVIAPHKPYLNSMQDEIKSPNFLRDIIRKVGITEGYNVASPKEFLNLIERIEKNLKIQLDKANTGPDRVLIRYTGREQNKVVNFVNEIREAYADDFRERFRDPSHKAFLRATDAVETSDRKIQDLRARQSAFLESAEARAFLGQGRLLSNRQEGLQEDRSKLKREISELRSKENRLILELQTMEPEKIIRRNEVNPRKEELRLKWAEAKKVYNYESSRFTDTQKTVKQARDRMVAAKEAYDAEDEFFEVPEERVPNREYLTTESELASLRREIDAKKNSQTAIDNELVLVAADVSRVPDIESRAEGLRSEIEKEGLTRRTKAIKLEKARSNWFVVRDSQLFRVVTYPESSSPPVFPSVPLFIGIGAVAGLLIGVGLAFLREFSSMTFATTAQVKNSMPLPVLGEVARIASDAEAREERAKKTRGWLITALVVVAIGILHLFYFEKSLSSYLPGTIVQVMDKLYLGR